MTTVAPVSLESIPQRLDFQHQPDKPMMMSGLGQGWCWANEGGTIKKLDTFCGGGGEGASDISCTPFYYRPYQFNWDKGLSPVCKSNNNDPYDIVNGAKYNMGARTWASFPKEGRKDYWVFHNCDGAGIQPDCLGDIKYIERFDGPPTSPECESSGSSSPHGRNHCTFTHPNSGTTFGVQRYWAGWYSDGNTVISGAVCGAGPEQNQRKWNKSVCQKIQDLHQVNPYANVKGVLKTFNFALYPWVCEADSSMPNTNFTSPTMDTFGVKSGWKCYADNEPGCKDDCWPPFIEIYYAGLFDEGNGVYALRLDKWMINNSDTPELIGKGYRIYPCNSGDNCEW
ncbi:hypothetical protein [Synechococcus sp. MIT S9509]|uniref:hypothetical protein n=1 Tax=Synechococcus sp. MIT S9509 TaxID=1801630 RepID=UPI0012E8C751|nr:hypothetical protein [Synechococcus sp. MIT S9509]